MIFAVVGILFFIKKASVKEEKSDNYSAIYDSEGNLIADLSKENDITETIEGTTVQGIVESHSNGYIYIFNGQHFGEFGFDMEEYTRANITDKKQKCIDYLTLQEYDTDYIEEDDIHSDTSYNFPFGVKAYITDNTEIEGDLQNCKSVEVEYEDLIEPFDELNLKSIKVIDE